MTSHPQQPPLPLPKECLTSLLDDAVDAVYINTSAGIIVYANRKACEMSGYSREQLLGMHLADLDPVLTQAELEGLQRNLKYGRVAPSERLHKRADGYVIPVEIGGHMIQSAAGEFAVTFVRDIRERKAMERNIAMAQVAMESASDLIIVFDAQGYIIYCNSATCIALGYMSEEMRGMHISQIDDEFQDLIPGADADQRYQFSTTLIEARHRCKDGRYLPVELKVTAVEVADSTFLCSIARDMTERLEAQQELRKYHEHLEELIAVRTAELQAAQDELLARQRMAVLGQLTTVLGHELRNPLGTIRTSLYHLRERMPPTAPALNKTIVRAERNIARCDSIIDELLSYTRNDPLDRQIINLDHWLERMLGAIPLDDNVKLSIELGSQAVVSIEPDRFLACLRSAMQNAMDAMRDGGFENRMITVRTCRRHEVAEICVADTGPGIPEDVLPHVFEPLFGTKSTGVGLGLPIVEQILHLHGGGVRLANSPIGGAELVMTLPMLEEAVTA